MRHLYIAEIYRNGAIFVADSTGLSSFTSAQRASEKKAIYGAVRSFNVINICSGTNRKPYRPTGWAKLNGANAVSFVVVKHVLENFDNFWQVK